ncbi:MAG: hypothetical protein GYA24_19840 [Candidatus Lokiarchaeota archaeon]|nr:hypothetical protein [Candidatus Lokiarchaeota archaeon]
MTLVDSWKAYKTILDGIAEWGGKISNDGIVPDQPRTWNGHVPTLVAELPGGRWERYVQDASLAAKDQMSFRNHVILALAAEKARMLAITGPGMNAPATTAQPAAARVQQITYSTTAMPHQQGIPLNAWGFGSAAPQPVAPVHGNRVDDLLDEARGYRRAGKWAQAKDVYSQVLAIQPGNPEAKEGLNVANQKAGMKFLAIFFPLACGGMLAFILIFLWFALNW